MHFAVPLFGHRLHIERNLVSNFSGNSLKLMPPDALICTKFKIFWGFPQTPLGELTALPRPPSWVEGGRFAAGEGRGGEGKGGEGRRSLLSRPTFQLVPTPLTVSSEAHLCTEFCETRLSGFRVVLLTYN